MNAHKPHEGKDHKARIVQAIADFQQRGRGAGKQGRRRRPHQRRKTAQGS